MRFFVLPGSLILAFSFAFAQASVGQNPAGPLPYQDAIKEADKGVDAIIAIPAQERTFKNTVLAIDDITDRLSTETSLMAFMSQVSPDAALRDKSRETDIAVSNWQNALYKRSDLYNAVQQYAGKGETLSPLQSRLLSFTLRDFRRNGMGLPQNKRDELTKIDEQVTKLQSTFAQNLTEDNTTAEFTKAELDGIPARAFTVWPQSQGVYLIPTNESNFDTIIIYANNEETRKKAWFAYKRRGGIKNVNVLKQVIKLRAEEAKILGYPNTAAYELEVRMAKNPQTVMAFYQKLKPIVRKKALADYSQFLAVKKTLTHDPNTTLHPWDQPYIKHYLLKTQYSFDDSKLAEYFPADRVFDGIFRLVKRLYGLSVKDVTSHGGQYGQKPWAPGVRYLEVDDAKSGRTLGHMYLDLYPRPDKYSRAACWPIVQRKSEPDGTLQLPIVAMIANIPQKTAKEPALLSHDEVQSLYHEIGHCMHNLLTQSTIARFSGWNVEMDFLEAPSQMLENWVWAPEVLKTWARHYKTGEVIPDSMLKAMNATSSVGTGLETEHQMYYGIVDQKYYSAPSGDVDTTRVGIDTMHEVELYDGVPGTMFEASFDYLMSYDAGYYSYLWSLVFAQDMFQKFKSMGLMSPKAGTLFRACVLSKGGTEDADQMLRDYLGRDPKFEPFLNYLQMAQK